ncbi:transglycosylase domain-containing protein [Dictyobacter arantiisoli]|uniref:Uncharacterized protein n=1 Tax=Dictyobacter arantiisoli TaxID=2014874 RepID=A0A5A5T644_9CHLR|nr:transglycosylase domain-containing protein [Dictyobacter arantiisoli]GCF06852.1 hypothetical protein KDI_04160 [Dictyobacter arantiisoli]
MPMEYQKPEDQQTSHEDYQHEQSSTARRAAHSDDVPSKTNSIPTDEQPHHAEHPENPNTPPPSTAPSADATHHWQIVPYAHNDIQTRLTPTRQKRIERARYYLEQKRKRSERLAAASTTSPLIDGDTYPSNVTNGTPHNQTHPPSSAMRDLRSALEHPVRNSTAYPLPMRSARSRGTRELLKERKRHSIFLQRFTRRQRRNKRIRSQHVFRHLMLTGLSIVTVLALLALSITSAGSYVTYRFYHDTTLEYQKRLTSLHDLTPRDNLKIYDSSGTLLSQMTDQGLHTTVPLTQIAPNLINATVTTEDKNFWKNSGVDIVRIIEAAIQDLQHGRVVAGGSTITQQLIKNLVVGNETNIMRKLQEVMLTPEINALYQKKEIMEMYLDTIYYGKQAYGIDAAANMYFGLEDKPDKPASSQLDLAQSAMLAGIPSSPSLYDPDLHPQTTFNRFLSVLNLMQRQGYITHAQAQEAIQEAQKPNFFKGPSNLVDLAPHFTQYVINQLEQQYHLTRQRLSRSGLAVYTTLNITLQNKIQKIMQGHIAELAGHNITNAAEVLMDDHTGAIISLLGSLDYNNTVIDGKFDVATMGYRQPGSSFKPYVYATALSQGYSPAQGIDDGPLTIVLPPGSKPATYAPENYDKHYHGQLTLRCALQNSLNIPAVKTLQHVGINNALQTAKEMGIVHTKGYAGYSMVLGGLDVSLLEHTTAFGAFGNNGKRLEPYAITRVVNTYTHKTMTHQDQTGPQTISPQVAYMMTNILSDNDSRLPEFLDCNPLQLYSNSENQCYAGNRGEVRPAAAKTGTTNDFRDNWTMGYSSDFVMGVWAGNDNNTPMIDVTGVQGAAPIWHDSMLTAEEGHPIKDFVNPGGLERSEITDPNGVRSTDWYLPGHYPVSAKAGTPVTNSTATKNTTNQPKTTPITGQEYNSSHPYCSNFNFAFSAPHFDDFNRGWW